MLKVRQQSDIGVGERRAGSSLQALDGLGRVRASNDVEPLLYIALVPELRLGTHALRREKLVEVELIELAAAGDGKQLFGHLVGEQAHVGQCPVGIALLGVLLRELTLGPLLIGVGPVEDLLLDELTCCQSSERSAGEVQIRLCLDREEL